jgi:hypothetical protein
VIRAGRADAAPSALALQEVDSLCMPYPAHEVDQRIEGLRASFMTSLR